MHLSQQNEFVSQWLLAWDLLNEEEGHLLAT